MEGQRERTSSRRRQRRKSKNARGKITVEPVLIAARRPDSPLLKNGFHTVIASAEPKRSRRSSVYLSDAFPSGPASDVQTASGLAASGLAASGLAASGITLGESDVEEPELNGVAEDDGENEAPAGIAASSNGASATLEAPNGSATNARTDVRRRAVRIVKAPEQTVATDNREQRLLERLMRSQGRVAISRAANELWESKFKAPRQQEVQIQLLEHENEHRARDAVFVMAELLQRESPVQRPVLDQRLRRLEEFAEDPITRDAARALRRSMRVHHGM
jgi:hypothetical protein